MTRVGDGNVTSGAVGAATEQGTNSVAMHVKVTPSARAQGATMAPRSSARVIHIAFRIFELLPRARLNRRRRNHTHLPDELGARLRPISPCWNERTCRRQGIETLQSLA